MTTRRLAARLCPLVILLAVSSGCHLLQRARPVVVLARGAETVRPVSGAEVQLRYPQDGSAFAPSDTSGSTGGDGVSHLWASASGDVGVTVRVSAAGYLSEEKYLSTRTLHAIEP